MVDRKRSRRLRRRDYRRELDPALSRSADSADRFADATLIAGDHSWPLFTNRWRSGAIAPAGHVHIGSFHLDYSVPVWTYEIGDHRIEARIWMEPGAHTTYAAWLWRP